MPRRVRLSAQTAKSSISRPSAALASATTDGMLDLLAAHQQRAVRAMHQGREAPERDTPVGLDALRGRQPLPERAAVDIHEVVGDQPAIAVERLLPINVGGRVPLVELGLLI